MAEDIERISGRAGLQSRRFRKRLLAVRAMAGETAWLDGRLVWHEGGVAWETPRGPFSPGPGDLALGQRRLGQIAGSPRAAARALDDASAWLARRFARLETAKQLHTLAAPDLPGLARRARAGNAEAIRHLAGLLPAEAMCLNDLPASPSAALVPCGGQATGALQAVVEDGNVPVPGRALAALVLGALHRQRTLGSPVWRPPAASPETGWLKRAYAWGLRSGLPSYPALTVTLLAGAAGDALARRCQAAIAPGPFALPAQMLRDLLERGVPATTVVATAEAAVSGTTELLRRMMRYRDQLPGGNTRMARKRRRDVAEELKSKRQGIIAALSEAIRAYVGATPDPATVQAVVQIANSMLDLGAMTSTLAWQAVFVLREGLSLPPELQARYVELLAEEHDRIWDKRSFSDATKTGTARPWLDNRCYGQARSLASLLRSTKSLDITREALKADLHVLLASFEWRDPEMYRFAVALIQDFEPFHSAWHFCSLLDGFPTARAARGALQPLIQTFMTVPQELRGQYFEPVLQALPYRSGEWRGILPGLVRHIPRLIDFAQASTNDDRFFAPLITAVIDLDRAQPGGAERCLGRLLSYLSELSLQEDKLNEHVELFRRVAPVALALAGDDLDAFIELVRAGMQHRSRHDQDLLEAGISVLGRFPALRPSLAHVFPRQPHRCAEVIAYLGLLDRFGKGASAPLAVLDWGGDPDPATRPPGWQALVETLPELAPVAAAYVRAQELLGGSADVPSGVRRALEQPARLARELAYLEGLPDLTARPSLAARAANLRARLADGEGVEMAARAEAAECLRHVTAEAQLAATEQQLMLCYKTRLESVAGPLPASLRMDEDLLNATLLTADLDRNRRLLLKLLRAHIAGDTRWPERHPPNLAFLRGLEERGVDVSVWLSSMPRAYKCPGVAGGRVRLYLETDPLHILQMGNYFDTCLSFGQMNAFSTVANACELNKRVIYARDGGGQVVGRKLIGISKDVELVGFRTYSTLPGDTAGALRAIFNSYASDFAARCGLRLADEGEVPALFATWYDDGVVPWREQEAPGGGSKAATLS